MCKQRGGRGGEKEKDMVVVVVIVIKLVVVVVAYANNGSISLISCFLFYLELPPGYSKLGSSSVI